MRTHFEGLGDKWHSLLDNPKSELAGLAYTVANEGGTRPVWQHSSKGVETVMLAYPAEAKIRGAVLVSGKTGEQLQPKTVFPFMEGLPNDMTVEQLHVWKNGLEGETAALRNEDGEPLWFYNPLLFRDKTALTPGVRHTFLLSALCMALRPALLDEMSITQGPHYEEYAALWLSENPGASRLDVPQLKIPLSGARILAPGSYHGDYQMRVPITSVEETEFGPHKVYMLHVQFGLNTPNPLDIMMYAPERCCQKITPKAGDEVDAYAWIQGRIID